MARLAIRKVIYEGENYSFKMDNIPNGLVVIEGDNGTGKTTFCDLIYYGLSGTVDEFLENSNQYHQEVVTDKENYVLLEIEIDGILFLLQRFLRSTDIIVTEPDSEPQVFVINRRGNAPVFSDWMIGKLGIEPVALFYMNGGGIINILDLIRLMYHDQGTSADEIMKRSEKKGEMFANSKVFRRAIFEILMGRSHGDLYAAISELKKFENKISEVKNKLSAIELASSDIKTKEDSAKTAFLIRSEMNEIERQISALKEKREKIKGAAAPPSQNTKDLEINRAKLKKIETNIYAEDSKIINLQDEVISLLGIQEQLSVEISQIKKVTYVHKQLKLFSPDTCPYCLSSIDRPVGKCICGSSVDESKYERFFYSTTEYHEIIKSKTKNLRSIESAVKDVKDDLSKSEKKVEGLKTEAAQIAAKIEELVSNLGFKINFNEVTLVEDEILKRKEKFVELENVLKLTEIKDKYDQDLNTLQLEIAPKRSEVKHLEALAEKDMSAIVKKFSETYSKLCQVGIPNCSSARINNDFEPVLNNGKYLEDSSVVAKRLMYYYTLLHLSIEDKKLAFPRFLLVDTPETAGVSVPNLLAALDTLFEIAPENKINEYQVIMTTGLDRFPERFKKYRKLILKDSSTKLLKKK